MTFSALTASPGAAPGATRATALVAAARDLADEMGSASFTVVEVARRAGVSLKSFYRCYPSKDALVLALLADDSALGASILESRLATNATLADVVHELFALVSLPGAAGYAGIVAREYRRLREHHPEELRAALAPLLASFADRIDTADPGRDAQTVLDVVVGGIHDVVVGRVDDVAAHASYLARFCAAGLTGIGS
jgi:AcrR family transcriptional regulator